MIASHARPWLLAAWLGSLAFVTQAQTVVTVHAAGSLRGAMTQLAQEFEVQAPPTKVRLVFGASGLLKDKLLAGEASNVFASANMEHPQALAAAGRAEATRPFARNALCALTRQGFALDERNLVDRLLDPKVKVGTSTPKADPSGDYAFEMFDRIDSTSTGPAGSASQLKAKALQLTGGPSSPPPPAGRSVYAMLVAERQADVFVTYCTNAAAARKEQPSLQVVPIPDAINVSARYGLGLLTPSSAPARQFVEFVLGPRGQDILASHGFSKP